MRKNRWFIPDPVTFFFFFFFFFFFCFCFFYYDLFIFLLRFFMCVYSLMDLLGFLSASTSDSVTINRAPIQWFNSNRKRHGFFFHPLFRSFISPSMMARVFYKSLYYSFFLAWLKVITWPTPPIIPADHVILCTPVFLPCKWTTHTNTITHGLTHRAKKNWAIVGFVKPSIRALTAQWFTCWCSIGVA